MRHILLLAVMVAPSFAQSTATWHDVLPRQATFRINQRLVTPDRDDSFMLLLNTDTFAGPMNGRGNRPSQQVAAFRLLLQLDDRAEVFSDLFRRATPAGKLYAVCGLYFSDPVLFGIACNDLATLEGSIRTHFTCIIASSTIRSIVGRKDDRTVKLKPGQSLADWLSESDRPDEYSLDIQGGGYPSLFAGKLK